MKWIGWLGASAIVLVALLMVPGATTTQAIDFLLLFGSLYAGSALGRYIARIVTAKILRTSSEIGKRMSAAFSTFGFLFLPTFVITWSNANLGTEIKLMSPAAHFLWACVGAGIAYFATRTEAEP